jgi:hypothetical protein
MGSEDQGGQLGWILTGVPAGNFGAGADARVLLGSQHRQSDCICALVFA